VRSREERIFMIKSFVLRKKRECERGEEERTPMREYRRKGANEADALQSTVTSTDQHVHKRVSMRLASYNTL
jgi:hypothetical protein